MHQPDDFDPTPGVAIELSPGVRRILCNNPSPYTYRGTNTYLVGRGAGLAVIDPGPQDSAHLQAILDAVGPGQKITHIFVTHAHSDHSPLASDLARATGAPVLAYGDETAGQSEVMAKLAAEGALGGGEGTNTGFAPDIILADDEIVTGDGWRIQAIWTPGHFCNHLSFDLAFEGADFGTVFVGDLVMGWASSLVSPPDGDLTQFMESCAKMRARPAQVYRAGHGDVIGDPHGRLDWLIGHRRAREAAILEALGDGPSDAAGLATKIYTETPPALLPAATRNVLAHLIDLTAKSRVAPIGDISAHAEFSLV
jgi:glyoxylase-like metal-dependent hydrolase (beta-lactamase superfamily II)